MWYSKSILIGREAWEWRLAFWLEQSDSWIFNTLVTPTPREKWPGELSCCICSCIFAIKQDSALNLLVIIDNVLIYSMIYK